MYTHILQRTFSALPRAVGMGTLFLVCGGIAFMVGVKTSSDVEPIELTGAQQPTTTQVNVILQYTPFGGGTPVPLVVTSVMNPSQRGLVQFQEIHSGVIAPPDAADRCRTTSSAGRCNVRNIPVGGIPPEQYDIVADTLFLEFLTQIPLESAGAYVRFDQAACTASNPTSFNGATWCLAKPGGAYATEYFVTITLKERNTCTDSSPPDAFCDADPRQLVSFTCNPSTLAPTRPWEPKKSSCPVVECPDGNEVEGVCADIAGIAACSTFASCVSHQLCTIQNFGTSISYDAGKDTIILRGEHFGNAGGTVTFPIDGGGKQVVQVFPGPDWTDTEIRVRIPITAVSGPLEIHPNSHGFFDQGGKLVPTVCLSPPASIRAFQDQFSIISPLNGTAPDGVQLVSPGFETTLTLLARHNERVGRFKSLVVELFQGAFPDPQDLPLRKTLITQTVCPLKFPNADAKEVLLSCVVPIPTSAAAFPGPFTFVATLTDDLGESLKAVLLDAGTSAMAGDFNFDRLLTIEDAITAHRIARGAEAVLPGHLTRDTDDDGKITLADALFVLHSLTQK